MKLSSIFFLHALVPTTEGHGDVHHHPPANDNCLSNCWSYDASQQKCVLRPNSGCFAVDCAHDRMTIHFNSALFNMDDHEVRQNFGAEFGANLSQNGGHHSRYGWTLSCGLGECKQSVTCEDSLNRGQKDHLVFTTNMAVGGTGGGRPAFNWRGVDFLVNAVEATNIDFKCAYQTTIQVTSNNIRVNAWEVEDKLTQTGSLDNGFTLRMYKDPSLTVEVGRASTMIGSFIYGAVDWSVRSLANRVNFFIESCDVDFDEGEDLPLIAGNCYSQTFRSYMLQQSKVVSDRSGFGFQTFVAGAGQKRMRMELTCCVKVCLIGDCHNRIHSNNAFCPRQPAGFNYVANQLTVPPATLG